MEEFEKKLLDGFYDPIQMSVGTTADTTKSIQVGISKVYDTNIIYSRVIGLQASSSKVDMEGVMSHELSPGPTTFFEETGENEHPSQSRSRNVDGG